jgi:hypothetical protein
MHAHRIILPVLASAAALVAQVTPEQSAAIEKEGFENSKVMAHLDHLTNRIGPRLTSSDNLTAACEWARDAFKSFGIENARLELGFNRGPWWGRMTKPEPMELVCNTDAWTAGTRKPSRGPLRRAPADADALAAMRGSLADVWLFDPPRNLFAQLTTAMEEEGGFGFVMGGSDLLITGGRPNVKMDDLPRLPSVRVRGDCHQALAERLDAGAEVEVEFDIRNHFRAGPIPLYNVIADIAGAERPDEFVVVGGHIDSWDGATGTTDNGTGTATTLEAARILAAIGCKPRRTIRFMLWSGEEQGLLGSRAWVQEHREELDKYSACLVHDGGTNYVSGIGGMAEMRPQLETVFAPVLGLDAQMPFRIRDIEAFRPIGSDHESFTAAGVPGFFWNQDGRAVYRRTHHTQYDTFDAAIPEYQRHSSVVIATGALGLASLPGLLTRENMKVERGFGGGRRGGRGGQRLLGVQLDDSGVTIESVDEGVAQRAGLKAGDRILKVGDVVVTTQEGIRTALAAGPAETKITVVRSGQELTLPIRFER